MKVLSFVLLVSILTIFGGRPLLEESDDDDKGLKKWLKGRKDRRAKKKPNAFQNKIAKIKEIRDDLKNNLEDKVQGAKEAFKDDLGKKWDTFKQTPKRVQAAWLFLHKGAKKSLDAVERQWAGLEAKVKGLKKTVNKFNKGLKDKVTQTLKDDIDKALDKLASGTQAAGKTLSGLSKTVKRGSEGVGDAAATGIKKAGGGFKSAWAGAGKATKAAVSEAMVSAKAWLSDEENLALLLGALELLLEEATKAVGETVEENFPELDELADEVDDVEELRLEVRKDLVDAQNNLPEDEEQD